TPQYIIEGAIAFLEANVRTVIAPALAQRVVAVGNSMVTNAAAGSGVGGGPLGPSQWPCKGPKIGGVYAGLGKCKGVFSTKFRTKIVKFRQNLLWSLEKSEIFLLLGGVHPSTAPRFHGCWS